MSKQYFSRGPSSSGLRKRDGGSLGQALIVEKHGCCKRAWERKPTAAVGAEAVRSCDSLDQRERAQPHRPLAIPRISHGTRAAAAGPGQEPW